MQEMRAAIRRRLGVLNAGVENILVHSHENRDGDERLLVGTNAAIQMAIEEIGGLLLADATDDVLRKKRAKRAR